MEQINDIFDITDENNDAFDYTKEELNRYFESGHLHSLIYEEEIIDDDFVNDLNNIQTIQEDETILSQKLSQLSTKPEDETEAEASSVSHKRQRQSSTSSSPNISTKKIKTIDTDETDTEQEQIPTYLLATNKLFMDMTQKLIKTVNSINRNDIQQVAVIMHRIAALRIKKQITIAYLQSVTGELKERECDLIDVDRRVWPIQVQSLLLTHQKSAKTTTATTTNTTVNEDVQTVCENILHQQLNEMNKRTEQFQIELTEMKNSLVGFTSIMEETIQNYVQQYGIKPLKIKRDFKIVMIKHNYDSEILKRKYLHEKPNEYQIDIARRLSDTRCEAEKSKRELVELKQRVFYNKLPSSIDALQLPMPTTTRTRINDSVEERCLNKHEKMIQCKKLDLIAIQVKQAEDKYYQSQMIFDGELASMWENNRNLVQNRGMTATLINLMEERLKNITDRWKDIYNHRIDYCLRNSYDNFDKTNSNDKVQTMKTSALSCTLIVDTKHSLTHKQVELLNRGPTYVPPCQMYISSSIGSIGDIVKKQYAPLRHQLTNLFSKYHINIALTMEIQRKIYDQFSEYFSLPIPSDLQQRALYEKKLIQSIQYSLNKTNLILRRTANNMNMFYLGNKNDFEAKADEYLSKSDAFKVFLTRDNENSDQHVHNELKEMIESMNFLLGTLKRHKAFDNDVYKRLSIDISKVRLPYIYFLPDISKENAISLVPLITSYQSATWKIGKFLNQLLRAFVDETLQSTAFRDEIDFIKKLSHYAYVQNRLRPTTLFCTIKISNFYTLDTHPNVIEIVDFFLQYNLLSNKLEKLTILNIKNLLHLFLHNNIFCYKDKIYQFTKGSPNTMAITETLSNIYLFSWQKKISNLVQEKKELFGRYKDEIFFTWNQSNDKELKSFLQTVKEQYPQVQFQETIESSTQYLNAYVENRHGKLFSRVNHNSTMERYTLPYVMGHSKLAYSDWLRSALIRAVCYCSLVEDFHRERIYLELTCLVNGYSLLFVETHVQHFFNYFHASNQRYSMDQSMYNKFRQQWFDYMEKQHERSDQLQKLHNQGHLIHLNYIYEYGPRCKFNQDFQHLWSQYFNNHPSLSKEKCTILPTAKHLHSLNALLTQQKPFYSIRP